MLGQPPEPQPGIQERIRGLTDSGLRTLRDKAAAEGRGMAAWYRAEIDRRTNQTGQRRTTPQPIGGPEPKPTLPAEREAKGHPIPPALHLAHSADFDADPYLEAEERPWRLDPDLYSKAEPGQALPVETALLGSVRNFVYRV